jgi:hypothetical protein
MRKWFVLGVVLALASPLYAAPNVAQNTQKGSLLVFPDIDIRTTDATGRPVSMQTIVRLSNDGPRDVHVKCYYLDANKHRVDFQFEITANQPFWFDARTGDGTEHVTPYPNSPSNGFAAPFGTPKGAGLLACWVVDIEAINQLKWNHLSGSATVIDHLAGSAYEYTAYAFYAPSGADLVPVGTGGSINLNGVEYDACPLYMTAQFTPDGTALPGGATAGRTRVAIIGCDLLLQQDWTPVWTKLVFDIWNEEENKVTGAWECADTWHEMYLTKGPSGWPAPYPDAASTNFSVDAVGTAAARYRVQGVKSTQCKALVGADAVAVGVLAIQSTELALGQGAHALVGTNLTAAGKLPTGRVVWDPGFATPEGGVR